MTIPTPGVPAPPVPGAPAPTTDPMQGVNWGQLMDQAGEQLQPVPKGSYDCYVDTADEAQTSTQKLMYKIKLKIDGGPHNGRPLWTNITLTTDNPNALAMFFRNMDAFGLGKEFFATNPAPSAVAEALLGRRVRVVVDHRIWQGTVRENVKQIIKPTGVAAIAGVPVPGSTGVPTPGPSAPVSGPPIPAAPVAPAPAPSPPQPATTPPPAPAPPAPEPEQPSAPEVDIAAYRAAGWSDAQLREAGHLPPLPPEPAPTPPPPAPPAAEPQADVPPLPDVPPPAPQPAGAVPPPPGVPF